MSSKQESRFRGFYTLTKNIQYKNKDFVHVDFNMLKCTTYVCDLSSDHHLFWIQVTFILKVTSVKNRCLTGTGVHVYWFHRCVCSCVLVCVRTKETERSSWRCRPSLLLSVTWSSLCLWAPPVLPGAGTAVAGCQAAGAEATSSVRAVISWPPGCSNATPASQLSNVPTFCAKSGIKTAHSHLTSAHQLSIWQLLYSTIISVPNDLNIL